MGVKKLEGLEGLCDQRSATDIGQCGLHLPMQFRLGGLGVVPAKHTHKLVLQLMPPTSHCSSLIGESTPLPQPKSHLYTSTTDFDSLTTVMAMKPVTVSAVKPDQLGAVGYFSEHQYMVRDLRSISSYTSMQVE